MENKYFAGIDAGSTYLKVALIKDNEVIATKLGNSGINNSKTAEEFINQLIQENNIKRDEIKLIFATGYSRKIINIADGDVSEITAHAFGAKINAPKGFQPGILIDIGGQDSKIIYLNSNYSVKNFTMNDKCAAGTGKFLETCAQILETSIDEIGPLSLESKEPCNINSTCAVFAQSEIISLIARRYDRKDILAGLHISLVNRIIKMIRFDDFSGNIMLSGGGALNIAIKNTFENELLMDVFVANHPQFNGAIGAAYFAQTQFNK
ncbi:MAG: acyl-CoA dehydratase activase [Bacilli bacterium]|nr:acyl-CoA dehydratase activase [Bacilli bacterium]